MNDHKFEYFCDLDELADELTIDYRNKITFCSYIAKTYCAFNKIEQTEDVSRYINAFREQSDRLTRILNSK